MHAVGQQLTPSSPQQALRCWAAAFNAADLAAITALYDAQAVLWGTLAPTLINRPDDIRQYFERVFAAVPSPQVALGDALDRVFDGMAINTGGYVLTIGLAGGARQRVAARFSFAYQQMGGGDWLIVDHHSSLLPTVG